MYKYSTLLGVKQTTNKLTNTVDSAVGMRVNNGDESSTVRHGKHTCVYHDLTGILTGIPVGITRARRR